METYYRKRICETPDYEESYWGTITDPDGIVRDRSKEAEKFLANVKDELRFINSLPPSKILDVGCGLGFLLSAIEEKHEKFGLEISSFACEHASKFAKIYNSTIEDADFEPESFDVIIAHHVIEHIDCPEDFLVNIKKLLKPQGILILSTPDFESVCAKMFNENYRMLYDKTHVSLFSFESLKTMLSDFGFDIIKFEFPYFETEYFTNENILKMLSYEKNTISPACWGNFMTFYCRKN